MNGVMTHTQPLQARITKWQIKWNVHILKVFSWCSPEGKELCEWNCNTMKVSSWLLKEDIKIQEMDNKILLKSKIKNHKSVMLRNI